MDLDRDAAEAYDKYADELVRFATSLVGPFDADDVMSVALVRVLRRPTWRAVDDLRPYLFRAVINEARGRRRSADRRLRRETDAARLAGEAVSAFVRIEVLDALRQLTIQQRAVVFMTYWLDQPAADVARTLHVSLRTVERELTRARRALEVLLR
jgi:RNA polymerase sigma factor (sigma-70 family)